MSKNDTEVLTATEAAKEIGVNLKVMQIVLKCLYFTRDRLSDRYRITRKQLNRIKEFREKNLD